MQSAKAGQSNVMTVDVLNNTSGAAITTGTVTAYLRALTGDNAGKWFRASDSTWQAAEASAGAMVYKAGSVWDVTIVSAAWITGVTYSLYGKESGDLNIPYSEQVVVGFIKPDIGIITFTYTLTESVSGDPISGAIVEVYSEIGMTNLVDSGITNASGIIVFYLQADTYYLKRHKSGITFANPDTEVVA